MGAIAKPRANYAVYKGELIPEPGKGPHAGLHLGHLPSKRPCKVVWRQLSTAASLLLRDTATNTVIPRAGERLELMEGSKKTPPHVGKDHQIWLIETMRWFFRSSTKQDQGRRWQRP